MEWEEYYRSVKFLPFHSEPLNTCILYYTECRLLGLTTVLRSKNLQTICEYKSLKKPEFSQRSHTHTD